MAGTIVLGSFDDGRVSFEIDYDDNLDVLTFRCRNDSEQNAFGILQKVDDEGNTVAGIQYGMEASAGEITTIALLQGAQGIRLSPATKPGHYNGYSADMRHPF